MQKHSSTQVKLVGPKLGQYVKLKKDKIDIDMREHASISVICVLYINNIHITPCGHLHGSKIKS